LLAVLSTDADPAIAERAQNVLLTQPATSFVAALKRADADPRLFTYCSENLPEKPGVADALAVNAACPTAILARVAPHLTSAGIQSLLDNLERLTSDPQLVAALPQSQATSAEQQELLKELHRDEPPPLQALEEAVAEVEPDPVKRQTLMQRLTRMNVVDRLTLALKGGKEERNLLIRDTNKLVQRSVLQSPRLTDSEVEAFAAMTNLPAEILRSLSMLRQFKKNYSVAKNLVFNPKTPIDVTLHLLPRLNSTDLKVLTTSKNVPETLRGMAVKLFRQRKVGLPS
jgi:hypothetical protein